MPETKGDDEVRVRAARAGELDALQRIERDAARRFAAYGVPESVLTETTSVGELDRARRAGLLWVAAASDDEPIGFALVELLVSVSVGLVALAAVPIAVRVVAAMTALGRDGTIALTAAQAKLEELIAAGDTATGGSDEPTTASTAFMRTWRVEPVEPADPRTPARSVTTTVEWEGGAHRVTLESFTW